MSSEAEDYCKYFDLDEARFAFRGSRPQEIEVRRAHMLDVLIFDILLISGGVRHPDTLYPPRTPEDLKRLLEAISHSQFDGLKKDCLVYFLLKWHQDYREDSFVKDRVIPAQFAALSDAYWHLDTGIHIEVRGFLVPTLAFPTSEYTEGGIHLERCASQPRLHLQGHPSSRPRRRPTLPHPLLYPDRETSLDRTRRYRHIHDRVSRIQLVRGMVIPAYVPRGQRHAQAPRTQNTRLVSLT